ncbi:uncharacterized protein BCR38DRAFT_405774 [Pseudomassariella vexata]|uniref:AMP-activated protein kinase glycogen-binding domain-containing protein n=1 Tax=Pseudomassariella vexata TaxID=1141098 RepID=A0A1Y2EEX7_9PEZI|nr:uncharacterized protein BCR38DRAFT_405774 [Pseudomassariella vexata]ORY70132.1 hypothetical protein BCR38DRAFT_405774 [Pseudomassariella vexata]
MASRYVPVTLTYRKAGTLPPIFVAGTFSDPAWQPQEMSYRMDQDGEHVFEKVVTAEEGTDIQYKFRIGPGDWWALNEEAETVSDGRGNLNNLTKVAHVFTDTVLDSLEDIAEDESPECPMFAHECAGTPHCSGMNGDAHKHKRAVGKEDEADHKSDGEHEVDYDDPRLERFPSESRLSILAAMRRIETSTEEDRTIVGGVPLSPVVSPLSPGSSTAVQDHQPPQQEASRASSGSVHSERAVSPSSLSSIREDEEEKHEDRSVGNIVDNKLDVNRSDDAGPFSPSVIQKTGPVNPKMTLEVPSSDEDEVSTANNTDDKINIVRKRNIIAGTRPSQPDRPVSSASVHSIQKASKKGHWLPAMLHRVFVEWIGGFLSRFLGNRRQA